MTTRQQETGQHTLWIVEDNDQLRKQLVSLLAMSPTLSCTMNFSSCEPALEALEDVSPPDIILMDIGLPGMSGIEGTRRIKAVAPNTQIVVLTVFEDNDNVVEAICAGASGYLHKSSSLEDIVSSLQSILSGGAPINPNIARKVLSLFATISGTKGDYGLTRREKEILHLLVEDLSQKEIASQLFVSHHTVNMHLRNIYSKLQVQTRSGAVAKALRERLL